MSNDIIQLSIKNLLGGSDQYIIPMYQRNYAWEESEVMSLIQDVIDYLPRQVSTQTKNYYIGTLVVYERKDGKYEVIDGQQRLTTLSLLTSYLKNVHSEKIDLSWYKSLNIHFECRENSQKTFAKIFDGNNIPPTLLEQDVNFSIEHGYKLIEKILPSKTKEEKIDLTDFANYLFSHVQIMRVKVPDDTNLNHYFEIMNSRGEQLEKHEILKSKMMEVLNKIDDETEKKESLHCLHLVWEACANMESYSQMGFIAKARHEIYGENDWGKFTPENFDDLREKLSPSEDQVFTSDDNQLTLEKIIQEAQANTRHKSAREDAPQRFHSVINFPNFLLHVLRVLSKKDIPLDDKQLIRAFDDYIFDKDEATAIGHVKKFIFALLKCKYHFDQYIIKRDLSQGIDGKWSLMRLKLYKDNEKPSSTRGDYVNTFGDDKEAGSADNDRILMLLAAFHVSTPTLVYKHWLNAALYYLYYINENELNSGAYLNYLESVANAFMFDRFLAKDKRAEYYDIIYKNAGVCQCITWEDLDESKLSFGKIENNFVFNYLDYLLWQDNKKQELKDPQISEFNFTFRSSVEHYYPQHPMDGNSIRDIALNSFGNLCLISHSKNSRLSNFSPISKANEFNKAGNIDSIKQHLMTLIIGKKDTWDVEEINSHCSEMKRYFKEALHSVAMKKGCRSLEF